MTPEHDRVKKLPEQKVPYWQMIVQALPGLTAFAPGAVPYFPPPRLSGLQSDFPNYERLLGVPTIPLTQIETHGKS